jgi:hypothetical protein
MLSLYFLPLTRPRTTQAFEWCHSGKHIAMDDLTSSIWDSAFEKFVLCNLFCFIELGSCGPGGSSAG